MDLQGNAVDVLPEHLHVPHVEAVSKTPCRGMQAGALLSSPTGVYMQPDYGSSFVVLSASAATYKALR